MNRVINIFTFLVLLVYFPVLMVIAFDLSISNIHLKGMPFKQEIFIGLAFIVFVLGLIRFQRQRQGINDMKSFKGFVFSVPITQEHLRASASKTLLEALMYLGAILLSIPSYFLEPNFALPMMLVCSLFFIHSIYFTFKIRKGGTAFKIGIAKDVIAFFDREMHLYYYTGLKRTELFQQDLINFTYKEDLNLSIDADVIPKDARIDFKNELIGQLSDKKVYIDDSLRNWQ